MAIVETAVKFVAFTGLLLDDIGMRFSIFHHSSDVRNDGMHARAE